MHACGFCPPTLRCRTLSHWPETLGTLSARQGMRRAPAEEEIVDKRYNLELVSGISVLASITSALLMMALMLPGFEHRVPASNAAPGIAANVLPPAVNAR